MGNSSSENIGTSSATTSIKPKGSDGIVDQAIEARFIPNCPNNSQNQSFPAFPGSIFFSTGKLVDNSQPSLVVPDSGIFVHNLNQPEPFLLYPSSYAVRVSPDGSTSLESVRNAEANTQELIFYKALEGEEIARVSVPYNSNFDKWLPNGNVQLVDVIERNLGLNITRTVSIVNPITQDIVIRQVDIGLPDFAFDETEVERGNLFGFASLDPTENLVLYTAEKSDSGEFEVRLLDRETNTIIWTHETLSLPDAQPIWSEDGEYVLFVINMPQTEEQSTWWKLIVLTREGMEKPLPLQPFPFISAGQLNDFSYSPDARYIFYTAVGQDTTKDVYINRAFVVDTANGIVKEICDSDTIFIAPIPARNESVHWIDNDKLLYRALIEKDNQSTHSLRLLDIPSWATQELLVSNSGQGIFISGWTFLD